MNTLLLSHQDVQRVLTMKLALSAVERAFEAHGRGEALMPPKVYLPLEAHGGDFRAMPAALSGTAGVKWVNAHPGNPKQHQLPSVMAVYILSDPATAVPLAIMDGTLLTAYRTGAAAAIGSKHLAASEPDTLGIIGCGVQAFFAIEAHRSLWPTLQVLAADAAPASAADLAAKVGAKAVTVEEASGADLVCTLTPARSPVVHRQWLAPRCHINAMGADAPGKQELDPAILHDSRVFIDELHQGSESGEINVPLRNGTYTESQIHGTLGEVVARRIPGREDAAITVFDSTGLAVQDVALAQAIYEAAETQGLGHAFPLISPNFAHPST